MAFGTGVVGRNKAGPSAAVIHISQVSGAAETVVAQIEGIPAKTDTRAQLLPVAGMICIGPMAPACNTARLSSALSTCMTLRILCAGMLKRHAVTATNAA
jgi:hypothetical protein